MVFRVLHNKLIRPRSGSEDSKRREFVLNVVLLGSIVLSAVATMDNFIGWFRLGADYRGVSPGRVFVFTLIFVSLYLASRARFHIQASYVLVGLYSAGALYTVYTWGVGNPHGLLVLGLVIFMSGILISARYAFVLALFISLVLLAFNYLQINSIIPPNVYWRNEAFGMDDTVIVVAIFGVMTAISWLSNREIEKSLFRARTSETALKEERDHLEETVEERTKELRRTQLEKMLHLYRFAEFGKLVSGLLHDLVNPLTTVSLNLEQLNSRGQRSRRGVADVEMAVQRAVSGTQQMERFVQAAQRQIQQQSERRTFSVGDEIQQTLEMMEYRAKEAEVALTFDRRAEVELYGDPIKLNQLVMNLVANAVDAYREVKRPAAQRRVVITLSREEKRAVVTVQDWGCGIALEHRKQIFEPLFTTKQPGKGTGLGLSICKDILEKEFGGELTLRSKQGQGTTFTVVLPMKPKIAASASTDKRARQEPVSS